ncbi:MAG: hypothetical protein M3R04_05170, partial [bacterium]|nr:hypothetical protein [bacterium]
VYLAYFRTFYSSTQQKEDITLRYRFYNTRIAGLSQNASVAVSFVRSEFQDEAIEVELQYNVRFGGKKHDKATIDAAHKAAEAGQVLTPEQQRMIRDPDAPPANPTEVSKPMVKPPVKEALEVPPDGVTENVANEVLIAPPPPEEPLAVPPQKQA